MFKISQSQFMIAVRAAIHWAAATLGYSAFLNGSTGQMIFAGILAVAGIGWSLFANRISAKINDLLGANVIEVLVTKDADVANNIESDKVVSLEDVKSPVIKTETASVAVVAK